MSTQFSNCLDIFSIKRQIHWNSNFPIFILKKHRIHYLFLGKGRAIFTSKNAKFIQLTPKKCRFDWSKAGMCLCENSAFKHQKMWKKHMFFHAQSVYSLYLRIWQINGQKTQNSAWICGKTVPIPDKHISGQQNLAQFRKKCHLNRKRTPRDRTNVGKSVKGLQKWLYLAHLDHFLFACMGEAQGNIVVTWRLEITLLEAAFQIGELWGDYLWLHFRFSTMEEDCWNLGALFPKFLHFRNA